MRQTFDKEKVNPSLARLKTHGETFELVIDPEGALRFRHGEADINEALLAPHVYKDVQTGEVASEQVMEQIFKTSDSSKVAEKIIKEGELHFNDEYKEKVRNEKKEIIARILIRDGAEAATGAPLNDKKVHAALSKVTIDLYKDAEAQVKDIVAKIKPYLAITLESKILKIRIPASNAAKLYGSVTSKAKVLEENWLSDGAWSCRAELPAGAAVALIDDLKKKTHGDIEINIEK